MFPGYHCVTVLYLLAVQNVVHHIALIALFYSDFVSICELLRLYFPDMCSQVRQENVTHHFYDTEVGKSNQCDAQSFKPTLPLMPFHLHCLSLSLCTVFSTLFIGGDETGY